MSILWQTGEPPCGETLIMQYEFMGRTHTRVARCRDGKNGVLKWQEIPSCHIIGQPATRWSTLDAAPDVVGRLEKRMRENEKSWISLDMLDGHFEAVMYDNDFDERAAEATAPSLAAAIEQLCGGTDEDTTNTPRAT